jgi:hypothetical protein
MDVCHFPHTCPIRRRPSPIAWANASPAAAVHASAALAPVVFFTFPSTYKCPKIASAGPLAAAALHKLLPITTRIAPTHKHTYLLMIPCTACLKNKDKHCHLLPTCTPETAEPPPTAGASQACPRALVPSSTTASPHTTPRISLQGISNVPPGTWVRRHLAEFNPRTLAPPRTRAPPSTDSRAALPHWTELAPCGLGNPLVSRHMQVASRTLQQYSRHVSPK